MGLGVILTTGAEPLWPWADSKFSKVDNALLSKKHGLFQNLSEFWDSLKFVMISWKFFKDSWHSLVKLGLESSDFHRNFLGVLRVAWEP